MPFLVNTTKAVTDRLPKAISPRAHAVIDYATAGAFFFAAWRMWRRERPAAVSALVCGIAETTVAALTDYPGGIARELSFPTHGRIDVGLSLLAAALPDFMNFADRPEARFFTMQSMTMAAVTGMTDFAGTGEPRQLKKFRAA